MKAQNVFFNEDFYNALAKNVAKTDIPCVMGNFEQKMREDVIQNSRSAQIPLQHPTRLATACDARYLVHFYIEGQDVVAFDVHRNDPDLAAEVNDLEPLSEHLE